MLAQKKAEKDKDETCCKKKVEDTSRKMTIFKAERIDREKEEESTGPLLLSLHPPSGSHQRLTQEGAAMPCWGARERLLFPPGAAETTIGQCIAVQCSAVQCSPAHPSLSWTASSSGGGPGTRRSHPSRPAKRSTEQSHIPAACACQEALGTERKRERTESCSHWRLPNGVALRSTSSLSHAVCFLFTLLNNDEKVIDRHRGISQPARHCIHIYSPTPLALRLFPSALQEFRECTLS